MRQIPRRRLVSQLTRSTVAVVMAGGRGQRLMQLTDHRAKPATPFGGKYRIIDFSLSNCVNSGIRQIFILTQYKAHSLIQHVQRGWGYLHGELGEFIDIVPAQQQLGEIWYRGTADAVYQNLDIIHQHRPETVLILAGDHVYKMDYGPLIAFHKESGADITIGGVQVPISQAHEFGVMSLGADHRVVAFDEKPKEPQPMPGREGVALASMGIYVINPEFLRETLERDAAIPDSQHDFGRNIVPEAVANRRVYAYPFEDVETKAQRYWRDVGTVDAYWEANMDLTDVVPELDLYDHNWPIWTYGEVTPPAKFVHDEDGRRGSAVTSLVSGGCIVSGASLRRSLLFTGVRVNSFTSMEEAVVLPYVEVGRHAALKRVVIDRGVEIPEGLIVGEDPELDAKRFRRTANGVCLITQPMIDRLAS
jgi:glucose-1-phosphate adenylyltransferase